MKEAWAPGRAGRRDASSSVPPVSRRIRALPASLPRTRPSHPGGEAPPSKPSRYPGRVVQVLAFVHVLLSFALITTVLMHSGREAGMGGLGFTPASQGGTHIVERNLTRLTVAVSILFGINTVFLWHLLA
jgi:protein translocase SecG subunit